ncbi:coumaroyl-CoA:anthocyanidin 3-O-glucoside-6''-O-coumaroyltransferase 1-like [Ziziphus jujuba]|uniref:Coumaroyl-CoA:anthocyanidin 3-O-glucoside-6''-O-coumaroyltransferase 1-like n=1 Tax=Ziziphus jujuba TaxID=326968 RepID=A0ABM3IG35_ZIZJJ|nr:coumaroyl-CoA:anthocyanidin 3-O-glucoside-6''-O-coumaroyltransferase 1-like [Ziziphus jujuba]
MVARLFHVSREESVEATKLTKEGDKEAKGHFGVSDLVESRVYGQDQFQDTKASKNHVKKNRLAKFVFGVDYRYQLKPAIPSTYFGNYAIGRPAIVETKDLLGEDGILSALDGISEAIASLDDGLLDGVDSWASLINSKEPDEIPPTACIAWSPQFQVYNTDLGWGAIKKFEMTSIGRTGAICMSDSKDGNGGFEIGMVSQMKKIEAFASSFAKGLKALCNVKQSNSRAIVEFG